MTNSMAASPSSLALAAAAAALMTWRNSVEQRFRFNPKEPSLVRSLEQLESNHRTRKKQAKVELQQIPAQLDKLAQESDEASRGIKQKISERQQEILESHERLRPYRVRIARRRIVAVAGIGVPLLLWFTMFGSPETPERAGEQPESAITATQ